MYATDSIEHYIDMIDPARRFTGLPVLTEYIDGRHWRLARSVRYVVQDGRLCTVREGFVFDWASIPRIFWHILPPAGVAGHPYGIAALVHDWLYRHGAIQGEPIDRLTADRVFLDIMLYVGVRPLIARTMYRAVRLGGWCGWRHHS